MWMYVLSLALPVTRLLAMSVLMSVLMSILMLILP